MRLSALFSLVFIFTNSLTFGQNVTKNIITNSGDCLTNENGISLEWMIGGIYDITIERASKSEKDTSLEENEIITSETLQPPFNKNHIDINNDQVELSFYPNPTKDYLMIQCKSNPTPFLQAKIYDKAGQQVYQRDLSLSSGDVIEINYLSQLPAGIYTIILQNDLEVLHSELISKI